MTRWLLIAVPMVFLLAGRAWSAGLSEADIRAIREITKRYVDTELAANWDSWASQLTTDAVFLQPNGPVLEGRAAIRTWVEAFTGMAKFTATTEEVGGSDRFAYARGTYAFTMGPTARTQGSDNGKWLTIYEAKRRLVAYQAQHLELEPASATEVAKGRPSNKRLEQTKREELASDA